MSQDNTGAGICVSYDNLGVELLRKSLDEACPKARLRHDRTLGHSNPVVVNCELPTIAIRLKRDGDVTFILGEGVL
jgi:hypothetical protein